jgi:ppGpp synthetase/RelA/SpoT-type nucleotidyltranferase
LSEVVQQQLSEVVNNLGFSVLMVEHRVKTEKSLAEKLERKGEAYSSLEDIHDLLGFRVVCFLADEIDQIVNASPRDAVRSRQREQMVVSRTACMHRPGLEQRPDLV